MKEKILTWAVASDIIVRQIDRVWLGELAWFVHIENCTIHEVDFRSAKLKGFNIEVVEVVTTLDGKFDGIALWVNEIKGE